MKLSMQTPSLQMTIKEQIFATDFKKVISWSWNFLSKLVWWSFMPSRLFVDRPVDHCAPASKHSSVEMTCIHHKDAAPPPPLLLLLLLTQAVAVQMQQPQLNVRSTGCNCCPVGGSEWAATVFETICYADVFFLQSCAQNRQMMKSVPLLTFGLDFISSDNSRKTSRPISWLRRPT